MATRRDVRGFLPKISRRGLRNSHFGGSSLGDWVRILLFDAAAAKAAAEAHDEVQGADSRFRNRRAIHGKDRARLAEFEALAGDNQAAEVRALQAAIAEIEGRDREQAVEVEGARSRVAYLKKQAALCS